MRDEDGREVTSAPSNDDQDETNRIVTEAITMGGTPHGADASHPALVSNSRQSPPTEPFPAENAEGRNSEMQQP